MVQPDWDRFFLKTYQPYLSATSETICLAWLPQVLITSVTSRLVVIAETTGRR